MSDRALSITMSTIAFVVSAIGLFAGDFKWMVFWGMVGITIGTFSKK